MAVYFLKKCNFLHQFYAVYNNASKYRDGSVCTAEDLSTFHRMDNRSNQPNEGRNCFRNFVGREVVRKGAKPTMESWCKQQQVLENEATGRWMEVWKNGEDNKKKNVKCVKLYNMLLSYVKQYKAHKLRDEAYFQLCLSAIEHTWSKMEAN